MQGNGSDDERKTMAEVRRLISLTLFLPHPNAFLPRPKAIEDLLDHMSSVDQEEDGYITLAGGAGQGVDFPDIL